jgi:P27 family predicted phage terminase small subunit
MSGVKGQASKPRTLKLAQKTLKPERDNTVAPEYSTDLLVAPNDWDEARKKEWNEHLQLLIDVGVAQNADISVMRDYCHIQIRKNDLVAMMDHEETTLENDKGNTIPNPFWTRWNEIFQLALRNYQELGMTPASRQRVSVSKKKDPVKSRFDGI